MRTSLLRGLATLALTCGLMLAVAVTPSAAQDPAERVWIQIESYASLATATTRLRTYMPEFDDVNGFNAGSFYAITLGPYRRAEAERRLSELRASGRIPGDSFIQPRAAFSSQFFPIGEDRLDGGVAEAADAAPAPDETAATGAPAAPVVTPAPEAVPEPEPEPAAPALPEETLAEARQSEAQLTREERDALQIALQYFGYYTAAIDGAFGPGTRGAMTDWQTDRGHEATGVLTSRQRAELLDDYAAEIARLGYATVTDETAGIEVTLPMGMVAFEEYNFPFARYAPINDSGLTVLLISQPGDRATLFGLYEIMQTLEIVPLEGERERRANSFLLTGQNATLRSHTEARVTGGAVKGFTLLWEPERDTDMAQILPRIRETIRYLPGALDPAFVPEGTDADIDLVSGFEVRRPEILRSGFFVTGSGVVVTTTEAVTGPRGTCERILIDNAYPAEVAFRDDEAGLAILRPEQALAPLAVAQLAEGAGDVRGEVAVAGFPFDGSLSYATVSFGPVAAASGVDGETWMKRLDVRTADSEAGGPVIGPDGAVLGMVLPGTTGDRVLPDEVTIAVSVERLRDVLSAAGVAQTGEGRADSLLNRDQLARLGADIAVRVSCWN